MSGGVSLRAIGAFMSRLGPRRHSALGIGSGSLTSAKVRSACLLASFIDALRKRPEPVVVELGPASEGNVAFLGAHFACRIFVEDLIQKVPRPREGGEDEADEPRDDQLLPPLRYADESVDGILCWDLFDYLTPPAGRALAGDLSRMLRPGGALLLYHATESLSEPRQVKYEIVDETSLRWRFLGDAQGRPRRVIESREVAQLFHTLSIAGAVRLKSQMREVMFRKQAAAGG